MEYGVCGVDRNTGTVLGLANGQPGGTAHRKSMVTKKAVAKF